MAAVGINKAATTLARAKANTSISWHANVELTIQPDDKLPTFLIVFHPDWRVVCIKGISLCRLCHSSAVKKSQQWLLRYPTGLLTRNGYKSKTLHPTKSAVRSRDARPIAGVVFREAKTERLCKITPLEIINSKRLLRNDKTNCLTPNANVSHDAFTWRGIINNYVR